LMLVITLLAALPAFSQSTESTIGLNQTAGFADGKELVFTYLMNFMCVHQPKDDLNNNGKAAEVDPAEFQTPVCQVGHQPTIDPTGGPIKKVDKLWILVPFFPGTSKDAFTPELTSALNGLFGFVPQAFVENPDVAVQCPEPGAPENAQKGMPGTCTMHASQVDLGPVLAQLGKVPPKTTVMVPTPNHSHIIDSAAAQGASWWQVITVLVTDPKAWPDEEGTKGITSVKALRAAQAKGQALGDVPSNFFLFFGSMDAHHMH
jgi:hypothetical protein